jgi:hypothetical protein
MTRIVRTPTRAEGGLTASERAAMAENVKLWTARALRTEPADPSKLVPAIKGIYAAAKLKEPRVVIAPSPLVTAFAYGAAAAIWHARKTGDATLAATHAATHAATRAATDAATHAATHAATDAATYVATYAATDDATRTATRAATRAATHAATDAATHAATHAATDDATRTATRAATDAATLAATLVATYAATDAATDAATHAATLAATYAATYAATDVATDAATYAATYGATRTATRAATYAATYAATDDATRAATYAATYAATDVATDVATDAATLAATDAATLAATDAATLAATHAATDDATHAATYAATDDATRTATRAATHAATLAATDAATRAATDAATRTATRTATLAATDAATHAAAKACYEMAGPLGLSCAARWASGYQGGAYWAGWEAYLSAARDILGLRLPAHENYAAWEQAAIHGALRIMHEEFCIVSDFPEVLRVDDENRPHCEDGPSHRWRDGWSLYHWHGVRVPVEWIEDRAALTARVALTWENVEQRRAACEIVGWARIVDELGGRILDADADPEIGTLLAVTLPGNDEEPEVPARFLRVKCGTGRDFAICVPETVTTAIEAQAWMLGLPADVFKKPEIRT